MNHTNRPVIVICSILKETVSMQSCDDVAELVVYFQLDGVSIVQLNCGRRPFAVDSHHPSLELSVWIGGGICDIPFKRASCCES